MMLIKVMQLSTGHFPHVLGETTFLFGFYITGNKYHESFTYHIPPLQEYAFIILLIWQNSFCYRTGEP